jgi:hypothetical protein
MMNIFYAHQTYLYPIALKIKEVGAFGRCKKFELLYDENQLDIF